MSDKNEDDQLDEQTLFLVKQNVCKMFELLESVKKNNFIIKSIKSKDQRQNKPAKVPKNEVLSVKTEERERIFRR